jgi:hypothetical protein
MTIGVQKAGTSTLHFLLNQHPDLSGSNPKEIHYFDTPPEERKSLEWYKSHFSQSIFEKKRLFFETTPNYIYHGHIPVELFDLNPSLRFIVMLRNPVTRCFSAWNMYKNMFEQYKYDALSESLGKDTPVFQYFFKDRTQFPPIEECLNIELDLIKQNQTMEPALLRRGLYYDQLENYLKIFPRERIFIVELNDFRINTYNSLDQIAHFVGVSPFDRRKLNMRNLHVRKYSDTLQDSTRSFLDDFYKEPNQKLYDLLGVRFRW